MSTKTIHDLDNKATLVNNDEFEIDDSETTPRSSKKILASAISSYVNSLIGDQYPLLAPASDTRNVIQPTNAAYKALVLKGAASQSDYLTEWQDSAGVPYVQVAVDGRVIVGNPVIPSTTGAFQAFKDGGSASLFYKVCSNTAAHTSSFYFRRARGTEASSTASVSGDTVFAIYGGAFSGTVYRHGAQILGILDGTVTTAACPTKLVFKAGTTDSATERFTLYSSLAAGGAVFNETGVDYDLRVEGDTDANLLKIDASTDRVGIGVAAPTVKLDVNGDINIPSGSNYKKNGANLAASDVGALSNVVEDTTPQLGGHLDSQDKNITGIGSAGYTQELNNGEKSADFTIDFSTDQKQKVSLTAHEIILTLDTTNTKVGNYILKIINGGLATLTWAVEGGNIYWPGGEDPELTASGTDIIALYFDGANFYAIASLDFS